jgi:hypothetical protein
VVKTCKIPLNFKRESEGRRHPVSISRRIRQKVRKRHKSTGLVDHIKLLTRSAAAAPQQASLVMYIYSPNGAFTGIYALALIQSAKIQKIANSYNG